MTKKDFIFSKDYSGSYINYKKGDKIWGVYQGSTILICHGMGDFETIPSEHISPTEEFYSKVKLEKTYVPLNTRIAYRAGSMICGIWVKDGLAVDYIGDDKIVIPMEYFISDKEEVPLSQEALQDLRATGVIV